MIVGRLVGVLALGAGFGAVSSLSNALASPFTPVGGRIADTGWARAAQIASLLLDAGWAWAGLAVAVGWLAGSRARGAVAGVLALISATTAYYGMDSVLRQEPFALYQSEMLFWWLGSAICGAALGAVGAYIGRPGVIGLLAGLTVPVGAAVQMIVLPPGEGILVMSSAANWTRLIVWVAAAASAGVVVTRFLAARRGDGLPALSPAAGAE